MKSMQGWYYQPSTKNANKIVGMAIASSLHNSTYFIFYYSIAVITSGKYAVLETGALEKLVLLLHDQTPNVRLNAAKVRDNNITIYN